MELPLEQFDLLVHACLRKTHVEASYWTDAEEESLIRVILMYGAGNWKMISENVPELGRDYLQIRNKYYSLLRHQQVKFTRLLERCSVYYHLRIDEKIWVDLSHYYRSYAKRYPVPAIMVNDFIKRMGKYDIIESI